MHAAARNNLPITLSLSCGEQKPHDPCARASRSRCRSHHKCDSHRSQRLVRLPFRRLANVSCSCGQIALSWQSNFRSRATSERYSASPLSIDESNVLTKPRTSLLSCPTVLAFANLRTGIRRGRSPSIFAASRYRRAASLKDLAVSCRKRASPHAIKLWRYLITNRLFISTLSTDPLHV
jgi:hypothetical protein